MGLHVHIFSCSAVNNHLIIVLARLTDLLTYIDLHIAACLRKIDCAADSLISLGPFLPFSIAFEPLFIPPQVLLKAEVGIFRFITAIAYSVWTTVRVL